MSDKPSQNEIETALREIFAARSKATPEDLSADRPLLEFLDSLTLIEIVYHVEEKFGISVSDEEIATLKTFGDVARGVAAKLSAKDSAGA